MPARREPPAIATRVRGDDRRRPHRSPGTFAEIGRPSVVAYGTRESGPPERRRHPFPVLTNRLESSNFE